MIDWHCHLLPGIDDGSKNVEQSIEILQMLALQGIDTVVATPHFFANYCSVDEFLEKRDAALSKISTQLSDGMPKILLGAETKYYRGIGHMEQLEKLCIEGTNLLLLEMPMAKWTEYTVRELEELSLNRKIIIILAHIERYFGMQSRETLERLYDSDILMQVNADFFNSIRTRRRALNLLKDNAIDLIGSDCHNTTSRKPQLDKAFGIIEKKLGKDYATLIKERGYTALKKYKTNN